MIRPGMLQDGLTPEQRDMVERCQQHARMREPEPMPAYMPRLVRWAVVLVIVLLVISGVTK